MALVKPVVVASGTTDVIAVAVAVGALNQRLVGFSMTENAAGTGQVIVYHGQTAAGVALFDVRLSAGESARELVFPGDGIPIPEGIFLDRTGTSKVTLFVVER